MPVDHAGGPPRSFITRVRAAVAERGAGTVIADRFWKMRGVSRHLELDLNWSRLDLTDPERPRRPLPEGLELIVADDDTATMLDQLPDDEWITTFTRDLTRQRRAEGHELWMVVEGDRVAFACWILRGRARVLHAPGGGPLMPEGVVMLEDSITHPDFRGRGIASAAWATIGDRLAASGMRRVVTKVNVDNIPSTKAVEKAGYRVVATMNVVGRPPSRLRFAVRMQPGHDAGDTWLLGIPRG